jgi:hypothetical protein
MVMAAWIQHPFRVHSTSAADRWLRPLGLPTGYFPRPLCGERQHFARAEQWIENL